MRYDSRFSLSVEIPKELWKCRVPHLIIQPVVENAVKHGLRPNKGPGEVVVQAKQNMDFLEITVMDNGVGINKERLEEVQALLKSDARIAEEDIKGMSIGVKNVSDRIKHLYGNESVSYTHLDVYKRQTCRMYYRSGEYTIFFCAEECDKLQERK